MQIPGHIDPVTTGTVPLRGGNRIDLVGLTRDAIRAETGLETELSTSGGTSDGRFIARICPQVIEFGPPNATIHKVDECIALVDIDPLKNVYRRTLEILAQVPAQDEVTP